MTHPVFLLIGVLCGYGVHRRRRRILDFAREQCGKSRWSFGFVLALFILSVVLTVVIFCFVDAGRLSDVVWQMPVGFLTGWLFSLQKETNLEVTMPWLIAFGLLLIIGSGPLYWRDWIDILGIKKLGDVEFGGEDIAYTPTDIQFATDPENEEDLTKHGSMGQITKLTESSIQFDFCYTLKYGNRYGLEPSEAGDMERVVEDKCNASDYSKALDAVLRSVNPIPRDVEAIKNVLDVLNGTIVRLAQCYESYTFEANNVGIADALRPFASSLSEALELKKEYLKDQAVIKTATLRLRKTLDAAMDKLRKLSLLPQKDVIARDPCVASEEINWHSLAAFVDNSKTYPYATIALAHLLDRIGEKKLATEYLGGWITSYEGSTGSMNLVRAHMILSTMIGTVPPEKSGKFRLGFHAGLEDLLGETRRRTERDPATAFLFRDDDDGCGEYSNDYFIAQLLSLKIWAENNFIYWTVENQDTNHVETVERFTRAIGQCHISGFISRLFPERKAWEHYLDEAHFLDTYAHGIIYMLDQKRRMFDTYFYAERLEDAEEIRKAIAAWTKAQRQFNLILTKFSNEAHSQVAPVAEVLHTIQENLYVAKKRLDSQY